MVEKEIGYFYKYAYMISLNEREACKAVVKTINIDNLLNCNKFMLLRKIRKILAVGTVQLDECDSIKKYYFELPIEYREAYWLQMNNKDSNIELSKFLNVTVEELLDRCAGARESIKLKSEIRSPNVI